MNFSGSRVVVTGGTGALGRVITERFLNEGALVWSSIRPVTAPVEDSWHPNGLTLVAADVTAPADVERLFEVVGTTGGAQILVNVAGAYAGGTPVRDMAITEWDAMMSVNLRSAFLCSRAFLRQHDMGTPGRIISIAAMPAVRPAPNKAAYAVSKAGVIALTRSLAEELKGTPVTANAVAPGIIDTPANRRWSSDRTGWVTPEEIAEQIVHLCGDHAASINGAVIPMFGGL